MKTQSTILALNLRGLVALLALAVGLHTSCAQLSFVPGDYYSANYFSRTITQYNPSGAVVGSFTVPSNLADEVRGLAFGPDGLLYASAVRGSGFNVLAYDGSGTLRQTYNGNGYLAGDLGYGKLAVDNQHIYVAGQNQLTRFDLGNPNSGVSIYQNNAVSDVDLMPDGNLLVVSAYYLDEITPDGTLVRHFPGYFVDARGVAYDPATDKLFVTELGYTDFFFQLMRFNWTTGVMEANTSFWYGEDIFLTDSGRLLVGSRTMTPTFFTENLTQVGTLGGGPQMFVTEFVPKPAATNGPPTLTCPAATVVECGTEAKLTAQVSDPEGDAMAVVWTLNGTAIQTNLVPASSPGTVTNISFSGSFPLGTNILGIGVTDGTNAASCSTSITVVDTTPPTIVCPASKTVEFQDETGAAVSFVVTASDTCSSVSLAVAPASGSRFPIGVTPVQATAVDAFTNFSQCAFTVTVLGARGVKSNVLAQLAALRTTATNHIDCRELNEAIEDMIDALGLDVPEAPPWVQEAHRGEYCGHHHHHPRGPLWLDETHVDRRDGGWVFASEQDAVRELVEIIRYPKSGIPDAVAQDLIDRLVKCDRLLAVVSIQDAVKAGANTNKIARILRQVIEGDQDAAAHRPVEAVADYWNAWTQVGTLHRASIVSTAGGQMQMQFPGTAGKVYRVQASSNLLDWQTVGTCTADFEGDVNFTDPDAAKHPNRLYRVVEQ